MSRGDLAPSEWADYDYASGGDPWGDLNTGFDPAVDGRDRIDWTPCPPGCSCPWVIHHQPATISRTVRGIQRKAQP